MEPSVALVRGLPQPWRRRCLPKAKDAVRLHISSNLPQRRGMIELGKLDSININEDQAWPVSIYIPVRCCRLG
jgi:hypothetical protein